MAVRKKAADAEINEGRDALVGDIAALIRFAFGKIRQLRIGRRSDVARREIGEKRIFTRAAVAVAAIAFRLPDRKLRAILNETDRAR
jgi:hypothetical protein